MPYGTKLTYGLNFPFDLECFQRKDKLHGYIHCYDLFSTLHFVPSIKELFPL